jgi:hypothetical protein
MRAEDSMPAAWTDVWRMVETEEETSLAELEEHRKGLQIEAAELVETAAQVIPSKKARGRGFFFARKCADTMEGAIDTVETINGLVTKATEVTLGFVEWVEGMGSVFDSIYNRAKALQEEEETDVKKVVELVKLAIIVTKDISSFLKDLNQWYYFVNGALQQRKKGAKNIKHQLAQTSRNALKTLQHARTKIRGNIRTKIQQALEWGIHNNTKVIETCKIVLDTFIADRSPLEENGGSDDKDGAGCEGADDDGPEDDDGGDSGRDFMSDMKSYCFQKFGKVAEDKLNRRAKIYDKVQIHLLCEYEGCHVPDGMSKVLICHIHL